MSSEGCVSPNFMRRMQVPCAMGIKREDRKLPMSSPSLTRFEPASPQSELS